MQQRGTLDKISNLPPEVAEKIWRELKGRKRSYPHKEHKQTKVKFPVVSTISFGVQRPCISWKDALRHLGEVLVQDVDKKSSPTIKGQIVEACAVLADIAMDESQKKAILGRAMRIVMETDRMKLMNQVASMATLGMEGRNKTASYR